MEIPTSCFWILLAEVSHKIPNTYTVSSISTLLVIVLSIIHLFALDNTNDLWEPSIPNNSPIVSAVTERSYSIHLSLLVFLYQANLPSYSAKSYNLRKVSYATLYRNHWNYISFLLLTLDINQQIESTFDRNTNNISPNFLHWGSKSSQEPSASPKGRINS